MAKSKKNTWIHWSAEEVELLKKHYRKGKAKQIADQIGRTAAAVRQRAVIEGCQTLLETQPCDNVIISFSVNNLQAAQTYEKGAAPVEERIEAATRLKSVGWKVRIRIDPMILGYDYFWILQQVAQLKPERVTLGTLRAEHGLLRFVDEKLFQEMEQPKSTKGLARYPKCTRLAIYHNAVEKLRGLNIGLCEETVDVWEELGLDTEAKLCNCCI
jgi:DNA repair photolyase